jgi:type II secretory ATPase GspE/PulE/Tfp pilus assembly ATPase PilB-like protein
MRADELQLENLILDANLVSREEMARLKRVAAEKGKSVGELAVAEGHMREAELRRLEAYLLGVPFVDLKGRSVDFATFALVPEPVARNRNAVAFARRGDDLEVALLDLADFSALEFLAKRGLRLLPRLTDAESMKWALRAYQDALRRELGDRIQEAVAKAKAGAPALADALLKHALLQEATDVHIEPGAESSLVRYRIGAHLHDAMILPGTAASAVAEALRRLGGAEGEGRFRLETGSESILCRFSLLPVAEGERVALRLVRGGSAGFTLEGLGLEAEDVEALHAALHSGPGLILAAGGPKSGKTTTLYTCLDMLNAPHRNLVTLEDELGERLPRVSQAKVRPETGFTYAHGLRTLLEQDPDVVMLGDLPDAETAALAASAARRHLVLASLEAGSPEAALARLRHLAGSREHLEPLKMMVFHAPPALNGVKRLVLGRNALTL